MRHVHALDLDSRRHNDRKHFGFRKFLLKELLRRLVYPPNGFVRWIENELIGCGCGEGNGKTGPCARLGAYDPAKRSQAHWNPNYYDQFSSWLLSKISGWGRRWEKIITLEFGS